MQITRRKFLASSALVGLASTLPDTQVLGQIIPLPPPPGPPGNVGGNPVTTIARGSALTGQYVVYSLMAKVFAIQMTAWYIGSTQHRQLTLLEVLFAPLPGPTPTREEMEYTMVAWAYDNLPKRREQFFFDVIGDHKPWTYPSLAEMKVQLKSAGVRIRLGKQRIV